MPIDQQLDCYATLGVPADAEEEAIRAAYKTLVTHYRPSRFSGATDDARRRLADLTTAYEVLVDPQRRRRYDFHRRIRARTEPLSHPPSAQSPRSSSAASDGGSRLRRRRRRLAWATLSIAVVFVATVYGFSGWRVARFPPAQATPSADAQPLPVAAAMSRAATAGAAVAAPRIDADGPPSTEVPPTAAPTPALPDPGKKSMPGKVPNPPRDRRAGSARPPAAPAEPCTDVTTALGLCTSETQAGG